MVPKGAEKNETRVYANKNKNGKTKKRCRLQLDIPCPTVSNYRLTITKTNQEILTGHHSKESPSTKFLKRKKI